MTAARSSGSRADRATLSASLEFIQSTAAEILAALEVSAGTEQ